MAHQPSDQPRSRRRFILWRVFVLHQAHRRWRWGMRCIAAVILAVVGVLIVLTHSPLTKQLVLPQLESICGMKVEASDVHISHMGYVVINNAVVSIPGVPGEAGRFLRIARVQAGVDWGGTLRGKPAVTSVSLLDPVLIISESKADGTLNIASVPMPRGGGSSQVPGITITNLGLEVGEHDRNGYRPLKRVQMDGTLTPVPDLQGAFDVHLQETMRTRGANVVPGPGFNLDGRVTEDKIDLTLVNFSLTDWPAPSLPISIREISEKFDITGQVTSTHFSYNRKEGITAKLELRNVAMNLPVEAEVQGPILPSEDQPAPTRWMKMSGVNGSVTYARSSVTARVGGLIEDLPYNVTLRYDGVDENSPFNLDFVSEDFPLDKNPELLLYAPPMVTYYLKEVFLRPTGIVTTHVNVKRGPPAPAKDGQPTRPGDIVVSGSLDFHDGTAAYEGFPYEFEHLSGRFEFDNDQIRIVRVAGVSPTGARLLAHGKIAPLDDSSEVNISVDVTDAQIDEAMQAAFGPERSRVITALFNDDRHKELLNAGLIRTPEQAADESRELEQLSQGPGTEESKSRIADLKKRSGIPVFDFRGSANVSIQIHSPRGVNMPYVTNVDIRLPSVGLVPEKFPYPIVASDVMVEVRNTDGKLTWGSFHGVNGGRADIAAGFKVPGKNDADPQVRPVINIRLSDIPLDDLVIHALPGADGPGGSVVKRILSQLGLSGAGSGEVHIAPRSDRGDRDLGFDADVNIASAEAEPASFKGAGRIGVGGITAHVEASESKLFFDLDGVPVIPPARDAAPEGPPAPLSEGKRIGGTLGVHVRGEFPPAAANEPVSFFVHSTCPSFDLSSPFESLVGVFSEKAADAVVRSRQQYHPSGFVDGRIEAQTTPEGEVALTVDLNSGRSLSAQVLGSTLIIPEASGTVSLLSGHEGMLSPQVKFDTVSGAILFAGQSAGIVSMEGCLPIGESVPPDPCSLEVTLLDARMEAPLTRAILEQRLGHDAMSIYDRVGPSGLVGATITLHPDPAPGATGLIAQGTIEPRSLALRIGDREVEFKSVGGGVEFEPGSGVLRGLALEAPEWSCKADGGWTLSPDGNVTLRTALAARGNKLSDDLRAVLPPELNALFDDLKLKLDGPFKLSDSTLEVSRPGSTSTAKPSAQFSGRLDFADASLEAGVPISEMRGGLLVRFDNGSGKPEFRLDLKADRFQVAGVSLTSGRAVVWNGAGAGQIRIPEAYGECDGGRLVVQADAEPDSQEPDSPRRFSADFKFSGVRFRPLLREMVDSIHPFIGPPAPADSDSGAETPAAPTPAPSRQDFARGVMDGELTLEGLVSNPESRRGRGILRISGGRVLNLPVVTAFIEASNLQFPFNSSLDFAQARFYVEGGLITFEDLSVQSRAIELVGRGTMTWPERELDLRFISRAARPIPLLSDIVQGIRNEFVVTTVTGKLGEQIVGLRSPGPSHMLEPAGRESQQSRERADADRRAAADRERRRKGLGIAPEPPEAKAPETKTVGAKEPSLE